LTARFRVVCSGKGEQSSVQHMEHRQNGEVYSITEVLHVGKNDL